MLLHHYKREAFHLFLEAKDTEELVGDGVRAEVKGVVVH